MQEVEHTQVEWVILCDYAQMADGKLFLQGGGWERLTVNDDFPSKRIVGIATSILIPWAETNQPTNLEIEVQTEDAQTLAKINAQLKVGRPPDHPPGMPVRATVAANLGLTFKTAGSYVIIARLEEQVMKRTTFYVIPGPLLAMKQQQQQVEQQRGGDQPVPE
ncbi:MAG: hypothetical protein IH959_01610 [Chloroflexi bacterium]|nr:hypothetical protein [Chloroflexota bacterium]